MTRTSRSRHDDGRRRGGHSSAGALAALLVVALTALVGCGSVEEPTGSSAEDPRPLVLTTFTVLADIAGVIAGDHLRVESLTKIGAEIHGYEPTPSDLRRAEGAALVLDNGLGLEAWFAQFIEQGDTPHVTVSDGVDVLSVTGGPDGGAPNPHAWMSPVNAEIYVENIVTAFGELDPAHAGVYRANGEAYIAELVDLRTDLLARLADVPAARRVLVTCEGAFSYLARDAGLTEGYLWPVNAEQEATPRMVARVVDLVRARDVPAVFCESTVSPRTMMRVVESTAARFGGTLYVDSLSVPGGPVPTYLDLLRHDADLIAEALTGDPNPTEDR